MSDATNNLTELREQRASAEEGMECAWREIAAMLRTHGEAGLIAMAEYLGFQRELKLLNKCEVEIIAQGKVTTTTEGVSHE